MESKQQSEQRFALLIDAENVSAKYIKPILSELSKYGTVTYKRIYGDWTQSLHARWKDALLENSITPIQQFSYTSGKNSTDSAMIIDAMDILYTGSVEGFCLVSSDSDFTRLASRLRESGVTVIGMGERKTPKPFRTACDIFTTLEVINAHQRKIDRNGDSAAPTAEEVEQAVINIITDNTNNGKSTGLGEVGSRLLKVYPDFDVRSFGTGPLARLLESFKRVNVIRDGNNITVELSEAVATESANESETTDKTALQSAPAPAAENTEPTRRRRGRARKTLNTKGSSTTAAEPETQTTTFDDAQAEAAETKDSPTAETAAESAPTERKPRRRGRPRKTAVQPEMKAAPEKTMPETQKADDKNADQKGSDTQTTTEPATIEAKPASAAKKTRSPKAQPTHRGRKPRKTGTPADDATDPKTYIRELVKASGRDGVDINELNRRLRSRFRGFKIRDLGYTRINAYIENTRGMTIDDRDGKSFAVLKSALRAKKNPTA